jgi:hypothetical protein
MRSDLSTRPAARDASSQDPGGYDVLPSSRTGNTYRTIGCVEMSPAYITVVLQGFVVVVVVVVVVALEARASTPPLRIGLLGVGLFWLCANLFLSLSLSLSLSLFR